MFIQVETRSLIILLLISMTLWACGEDTTSSKQPFDESTFMAPSFAGGKTDSYVNSQAVEYEFTGTAHFNPPENILELNEEEATRELQSKADRKMKAVANRVHNHLKDKAREMNSEIPAELPAEIAEQIADKDAEYKKKVMENWQTQQEVIAFMRVKTNHYDSIRPAQEGLYAFDFEVEVVMSNRLVGAISENGVVSFQVNVYDWYSEPKNENVQITGIPTASFDAFPRYNELFADGVFDIAIHVGGDYNEEEVEICCPDSESSTGANTCRTETCPNSCEDKETACNTAPEGCTISYAGGRVDRQTAKGLVEHLLENGFNHTVTTYKELAIDSAPFTKTYKFLGFDLEVRIKVVYPEIVPCGQEEELVNAMRESLASKEFIVYAGHAGSGHGFVLDYQPRKELDDSLWPVIAMPDTYQIVLMYGCQTYSTYADALYANAAKNDANLDVVTTVNTMWTSMGLPGTITVLFNMLLQDVTERHIPVSWINLLSWLNLQDQNAHTHYGVHGVDSDPKISPWIAPDSLCQQCQSHTDCGNGAFCFSFDDGSRGCSAVCTSDEGCGEGYSCAVVPGMEDSVIPKFCMPKDGSCR